MQPIKNGYKPLPGGGGSKGGKGGKGKKMVAKPRPGGPGTVRPLPIKKKAR